MSYYIPPRTPPAPPAEWTQQATAHYMLQLKEWFTFCLQAGWYNLGAFFQSLSGMAQASFGMPLLGIQAQTGRRI